MKWQLHMKKQYNMMLMVLNILIRPFMKKRGDRSTGSFMEKRERFREIPFFEDLAMIH